MTFLVKVREVKEMNGWSDYTMKQEQYRDQIRSADRQGQIKRMMADCEKPAIWQTIGHLVSAITKEQPVRGEVPCGEHARLAGKTI